jgi:hypothetical protein
LQISSKWVKPAVTTASDVCGSTVGWDRLVGKLIQCLPGVMISDQGGKFELEDIDLLTGLGSSSPRATLGLSEEYSACPIICGEGIIWGPP